MKNFIFTVLLYTYFIGRHSNPFTVQKIRHKVSSSIAVPYGRDQINNITECVVDQTFGGVELGNAKDEPVKEEPTP